MDLDFTSDQEDLRDAMRAVLTRESPVALARAVTEGRDNADALWHTVCELGWPALTVPEAHGGLGASVIEAGLLAEELGRVVAPGPLLTTVTQFVPLVRTCGYDAQQARWLGAVAAGECRATAALEGVANVSTSATAIGATARRGDDTVRLDGACRWVAEADGADEIACVVQLDGEPAVVVVPGEAVKVTPVDSIDGSRRHGHVVLDDVELPADRVLANTSAEGLRDALDEATVALALETVGVCSALFETTLEYARQREQFGKPIGSFQAIKHKLADLFIVIERARSIGYYAALCVAEHDERRHVAVSAAKAAAGDAQASCGKEGIQIHGGIGYTWEHDVHLYVKRAKVNDLCLGSAGAHRARIADLLNV
ncbi:MAG TPA: acyl-CoA dehydrogenase family protein [Acidimicrobiia bacterium]|jgi:alkylation response protein AidB-like acyl-CoA dehydrogenase